MSVEQAADAILALINSRPTSLMKEEIAAIVAKAYVGNVLDRNEDLEKWTAVVDAWLNADPAHLDKGHPQHAEADAAHEALCAATTAIWAKPVHSFADVVLCFVVAGYWNVTGLLDYLVYPNDVIARHMQNDSPGFDEAGLTYLMRGIMDLTGIEFDVDGRLRGGASSSQPIVPAPAGRLLVARRTGQ